MHPTGFKMPVRWAALAVRWRLRWFRGFTRAREYHRIEAGRCVDANRVSVYRGRR